MFPSRFDTGLLLFCVGALLASAISSDDVEPNEVTIRGNDKSFRVESEAGKIYAVHFEQDDDNDDAGEKEDFTDDNEDLLSFQVESLQEKNSAGTNVGVSGPSSQLWHGIKSLASQLFNLSSLDNSSSYEGIPVKNLNLTTFLSGPQARLELMVYVFLGDGIIHFGNETFRVQKGTMKFNIKISDWQFCGAPGVSCLSQSSQQEVGQFLDLALSIRSQAEEPEEVDDDQRTQANKPAICVDPNDPTEEEDDCPSIYNMGGNSEMLLNRGVETGNGDYVALPPGFPKFETLGTRNKRLIFRIPRFNNTVIIDPSVNVGAPNKDQQPGGGGPKSAASSLQFFSLALLLSVFIVQY